jgi:hypothetical protein
MRTKNRLKILGVCTILALGIVNCVVSAAFGASWVVAGSELATGETAELAKGTTTVESVKLTGTGVTITCTGIEATLLKLTGGTNQLQGQQTYTGCSSSGICSVPTSIATNELVGEAALGTAPGDTIKFKPKTGTAVALITFSGAECPLKGSRELTGTITATAPEGQNELATQELDINSTGELKLATTAVGMKAKTMYALSTGFPWSYKELAIPTLSRTNVGGVPKLGTPMCEFKAITGKCSIKFENLLVAEQEVKSVSIIPAATAGRFEKILENCKPGTQLKGAGMAGASCTDEVELKVKQAELSVNDYCIKTENTKTKAESFICATLKIN